MSEVNYGGEAQKTCPAEPEKKSDFPTWKEVGNGLLVFFGGSAIGLTVFLLIKWALSSFDIGYLLIAIIALAVSLVVIWALDKSMGFKNSKMQAAVIMVLFVAFLFTILNGHKDHGSPFENTDYKALKSETFIFTGEERWATKKVFRKGQTYRIKVSGVSVNKVNGADWIELEPRVDAYKYYVGSPGAVTFDGIAHGNDSRSTVTVEWVE